MRKKLLWRGRLYGVGEALDATRGYRNFIISSGCDIPPGTPLPNLEAFYSVVRIERNR